MDTPDLTSFPKRKCNVCGNEFPLTPEYWHRDKKGKHGLRIICKGCIALQQKLVREANPEINKAKCKARYYAHPEEREAYRLLHLVEIAATKRRWRQEHPDLVKKHKSDSQKRNRPAANARVRKWTKNHPEQALAYVHARHAKIRGNGGMYTDADIALQLTAQGGNCWWCAKPLKGKFERDHRIPLSRGGSNNPENIVLACKKCNRDKSNKLPSEWAGRLF